MPWLNVLVKNVICVRFMTMFKHVIAANVADLSEFIMNYIEIVVFVWKMLEYIKSLMFKFELIGADAHVHDELRIYYFDVHLVKAFVMELSMSISGLRIYANVYIGAFKLY